MAINDIIRLDINQSLQSAVVQNVLYYKILVEDSGGDDVFQCANQFSADVINQPWQDVVSPELTFDCISAQKVFPLPIEAVQEINVSLPGLNAGESLPAMSAALIQKFNPAVGGVGKKGRVYIAGIIEDQTSLGRINPDLKSVLDSLATNMGANLMVAGTGGEYEPVWVTRKPDDPDKGSITGFVDNLTFAVLPRIATQRRRRTPIRAVSF